MIHLLMGLVCVAFGVYVLMTGRWAWGAFVLYGSARYMVSALLIAFGVWIIYLYAASKKGNQKKVAESSLDGFSREKSSTMNESIVSIEAAISRLLAANKEGAFLIISVDQSDDFIQFTASPDAVELDMPLVTDRQRQIASKLRDACAKSHLEVIANTGSDGTQFIDCLITGSVGDISKNIRQILLDIFDVRNDSELSFTLEKNQGDGEL